MARIAKPGGHKFASDINEESLDKINKAFKKAKKAVEKNPPCDLKNLPKHAKKTELSKRIITRGLRSDERRAAHFHKQYDGYEKRANFLAQKQAQGKVDKANREIEKIKARLKKSEEATKEQKSRADAKEAEKKSILAVLSKRHHKKQTANFVKRLSRSEWLDLQMAAVAEDQAVHILLMKVSEFIKKFFKIA